MSVRINLDAETKVNLLFLRKRLSIPAEKSDEEFIKALIKQACEVLLEYMRGDFKIAEGTPK